MTDAFRIQQGRKVSREDVEAELAKAGLADEHGSMHDLRVGDLTGLYKLRFDILMTSISPLKVILVDMPGTLANLVSGDLCSFYASLKALSASRLVICTTQDKATAEPYADRIITLAGATVAEDTCPYIVDRKTGRTPVKGAKKKKERQHGLGFAKSFVLAAKGFKKKTAFAVTGLVLAVLLVILAGYATAAATTSFDSNEAQLERSYEDGARTVTMYGSMQDRGWYYESVFQVPAYRVFTYDSYYFEDSQLETLAEYMPIMQMESGFSLTDYYADGDAERADYSSNPYVYFGAEKLRYLVELDPETGTEDAYLTPVTEDSRLPQDFTEIAITDYMADIFIKYGYRDWDTAYAKAEEKTEESGLDKDPKDLISEEEPDTYEISSPEDLIGRTLNGLEIVGIFSTEEDLASFKEEYDTDNSAAYEEYKDSRKSSSGDTFYSRLIGNESLRWLQGLHMMKYGFVMTGYSGYRDSTTFVYAHPHPILYQLQGSVSKDMDLLQKLVSRPGAGRKLYSTIYSTYSEIVEKAKEPFPDEYLSIGGVFFSVLEVAGMVLCGMFMVQSMKSRKAEMDAMRAKGARQRDVARICWCQALIFLMAEILLALVTIGIACAVINAVYFIPLYSITFWSVLAVLAVSAASVAVFTAAASGKLAKEEVFKQP